MLNSTIDGSTVKLYEQRLNFKDGLQTWKYIWAPNGLDMSFDVEFTVFAARDNPNVGATRMAVTPLGRDANVTIVDLIDGRSAVRSDLVDSGLLQDSTTMFVATSPNGLPSIKAYTFSTANVSNVYTDESSRKASVFTDGNDKSVGQQWDAALVDGKQAVFTKTIGVVSSDGFGNPKSEALRMSTEASRKGWDQLLRKHTRVWNKLMDPKFTADYRDPVTGKLPANQTILEMLQVEAIASRYWLLLNLLPDNGKGLNVHGVSVGGLASSAYGGMLFWDQDFWMYPSIAVTNPEYARQILNARVKQFKQARANAQEPYVQAKYGFGPMAALYPWTAGRFGNATATGPVLDYEYHVNFVIALSMFIDLAITSDDAYFKEHYWPVVEGIGHTAATLLKKDGNGYSVFNMTDPDEYAVSPL